MVRGEGKEEERALVEVVIQDIAEANENSDIYRSPIAFPTCRSRLEPRMRISSRTQVATTLHLNPSKTPFPPD